MNKLINLDNFAANFSLLLTIEVPASLFCESTSYRRDALSKDTHDNDNESEMLT